MGNRHFIAIYIVIIILCYGKPYSNIIYRHYHVISYNFNVYATIIPSYSDIIMSCSYIVMPYFNIKL